jgi:hypothetical protein
MTPGLASSMRPGRLRINWIVVSIWCAIVGGISLRTYLRPDSHTVYPVFITAARNWVDLADLYDAAVRDCYRYSPLVAAVLTPFTLVPDGAGGVLWRLVNVGVFIAGLIWWARVVLSSPRSDLSMLLLLVIPLSIGNFNNGQSNPLVIGLLLTAMAGIHDERWNLAAAGLALACLFKVYPIAVGLLLSALYPTRLAGRLVLGLALGLAIPFVLQRPDYVAQQYMGWFHHLLNSDRGVLPVELWYRDMRLLAKACHLSIQPHVYITIQLVVAAVIGTICLRGKLIGWRRERLLATVLGLGCCWMTVFGPTTESSTYILLAPTLACSLLEARSSERLGACRVLLTASYALFTVIEMAVWFPFGRQFHTLGVHAAAGLLLMIALAGMALAKNHDDSERCVAVNG